MNDRKIVPFPSVCTGCASSLDDMFAPGDLVDKQKTEMLRALVADAKRVMDNRHALIEQSLSAAQPALSARGARPVSLKILTGGKS